MRLRPPPLPHRRLEPDVPRVPRDPRPDRPGRPVDQRRLRLRDDAAEADRGPPARVHRRGVRPGRRRRSAPSSPPTTRPTARRCRPTSPSRSRSSTRRARRWACPILTHEGFEADDVIGTLARQAAGARARRRARDGRQGLLPARRRPRPRLQPARRGHLVRRRRACARSSACRPAQVVDVLALMGDAIDNVKGVPGIGEKGARDLIATHGSLDALLAAAPTVPQKKYREALLAHADDARQSRELVRDPHRRAGAASTSRRCATAGPTARAATRCSRGSASARWSPSSRPTADTVDARLRRGRRRAADLDALVAGSLRARARSRARWCWTARRRCGARRWPGVLAPGRGSARARAASAAAAAAAPRTPAAPAATCSPRSGPHRRRRGSAPSATGRRDRGRRLGAAARGRRRVAQGRATT